MLKNSYITKSYDVVERNRMSRDQAIPGFPYISYKASQILEMAYSFKLLLRDNALEALYRDNRRRAKSTVDMTNKTLRDVVSKGYLKTVSLGHEYGNMYVLDDLGFEYLGMPPFDTDFSRNDLMKYYAVNRVFNTICLDYRELHTVEWETGGDMGDACSIVWKDDRRKEAIRSDVWIFVRSNFRHERVDEIKNIQEKYAKEKIELPGIVSVHAVSIDRDNYTMKVVENGKVCASLEEIEKWVDGR